MKKYFSLAVLAILAFAMNAKAQNQLIATLNHEGEIKVFYGVNAFADAHNAATHGDVITLSLGKFAGTNITKAITIQGAGITAKIDSGSQIEPTILQGNFAIDIADSITQQFRMEGIWYADGLTIRHLRNPQFVKCRLRNISGYYSDYSTVENLNFINCRIEAIDLGVSWATATFSNCVINTIVQGSSGCTFLNCYMLFPNRNNSEYRNCVINLSGNGYGRMGSSSSNYYGNLLITADGGGRLDDRYDTGNVTIKSDTAPNLAVGYSDENTYELTAEQKALYKGTDGTEVGIYGGLFPYDPIPNIPQITKFKVASKTTADGKLKVEVEIKGAE